MVTVDEEPLKAQAIKPKKKTFKEKLQQIKENITIEPVLGCYVIPGALSRVATQNLNLDKVCRVRKNFGDEICDAVIAKIGNHSQEEIEVQEIVAAMESWKSVIMTAIPCLLIIFLGAWSDRTGKRKMCLLLPIVGDLLMSLSNLLNAYYFYEIPVEVTMFCEAFFPAITGGWITTYMGAFAYISDVSSEESRTFRVGIANLCLTAGTPIGTALSGILLDRIGYYGIFTLTSVLYLISISYGIIFLKDIERPVKEKDDQKSTGICFFLKNFFDMQHVKDTLTVAFKKGPNNRRKKSILVLLAICFIYGPAYGEFIIRYMYTRHRFNWDAVKYSMYSTFFTCMHGLGALISISVFSRRLHWHDAVLGLISVTSKIIGSTSIGLARNSRDMYLAVVIETFNATSYTALRSISSKLVSSDELGKITSIFNLTENLTSLVLGPVYSSIYSVVLKINASIIFYMSVVLQLPALVIFGWFYVDHKKSLKLTKVEESIENLEYLKENRKNSLLSSIDLADKNIQV